MRPAIRTWRLLVSAVAVGALLVAGSPAAVAATTFTVTKTADSADGACNADCSLREAIIDSNALPGADTIIVPPGLYRLSIEVPDNEDLSAEGDLDITDAVTIEGAGADQTVVDAAGATTDERAFQVTASGSAVLRGMTIQGGSASSSVGGAVFNRGAASLVNVRVTGNSATGGGGVASSDAQRLTLEDVVVSGNISTGNPGGGLSLTGTGTVSITDSTVSGNSTTSEAGGLYSDPYNGGSVTLTNVTVSGNRADVDSGGISHYDGPMSMNNVTITGNVADDDGNGTGSAGGFFNGNAATLTVGNTIIAGNTNAGGGTAPDCWMQVPFTSRGHNLVQDPTDCEGFTGPGDRTGVNPLLGPLADNGGFTPTHALLPGSPAIDAGGPECAGTDQRGAPRSCDIGAYELVRCRGVIVNRVGEAGEDLLVGTAGVDGFLAQAGNDRAQGLGGADAACMGAGKDTAAGGGGKDELVGQAGKDKLKGQAGKDLLKGGPGKDTCAGGGGKDRGACEKERKMP